MLIHLVGSRSEITQHFVYLHRIIKVIKDEGHELIDDWVVRAYRGETKENKKYETADWKAIYKENVEALNKADVVVVEASVPSFGVGYQVAMAEKMKKPILILNREGVDRSFFARGMGDGIEFRQYNKDNLHKYVRRFLRENDIHVKDMRFNFFIDRQIYNYLRYSALKTGKTKAEILRGLVEREIENQQG